MMVELKLNFIGHIDISVQERRNFIANSLDLRLSCTNPSIYEYTMEYYTSRIMTSIDLPC